MVKRCLILLFLVVFKLYASPHKEWINVSYVQQKQFTWIEAKAYCQELNKDNKQWRLPTFKELVSLKHNNTIIKDDYYWSANTNKEDQEEALVYDISNKMSCEGVKNSDKYYLMCVTP